MLLPQAAGVAARGAPSSKMARQGRNASVAARASTVKEAGQARTGSPFAAAPPDIQEAIRELPWRGGLEPCGEVEPYVVTEMTGTLPKDLNGTFYVNGPGRIRVGGDGQVTALQIDGSKGTVTHTSKMVKTDRYLAQEAAGPGAGIVRRCAWTQADSPLANIFALPSNPANTSILVWGRRLYALCEGGDPVELDPVTLKTLGSRKFDARLPTGFSAHFKIDASAGPDKRTLFNIGFGAIGPGLYDAFAMDEGGRLLRKGSLPVPWTEIAFLHDCALSEKYLTVFVPAWKADGGDLLAGALGAASFGWKLNWRENEPTRVIIVRKSDMSVAADLTIPSMSMYHFCCAFEEGSKLHVIAVRLVGTRDALEANFRDMYSAVFKPEHANLLHEYVFDMGNGGRLLSERPLMPEGSGAVPGEFFAMNPKYQMRRPRFLYHMANHGKTGYLDALQKFDVASGTAQTRFTPGTNLAEALFVPREGGTEEDDGYLVYNEYQHATHSTDLIVLDAKNIKGEPICRAHLRHHVPYTFHGFWEPAR